jgi:hypothetical protein
MNSIEKIWARATGHLMGQTDEDRPDVPILTIREARLALILKTFWIIIHVITCFFIMANVMMGQSWFRQGNKYQSGQHGRR